MADWNPPDDNELDVLKPVKASNHRRIRDLATALAQGASGAPKIQTEAVRFPSSYGKMTSNGGIGGGEETLVFDTLVAESETILNTTTGVFTLPKGGMVKILFRLGYTPTTNGGTIKIKSNGTQVASFVLDPNGQYSQSEMIFFKANGGEDITITASRGSGSSSDIYTIFSGSYANIEYIGDK